MNSSPETPPPAFQTATPRQHALSCNFPEGCTCGASEFNALSARLAALTAENKRLIDQTSAGFVFNQMRLAWEALGKDKRAFRPAQFVKACTTLRSDNQRLAESLESARMHHQESLDRLRSQRDELEVQLAQLTQHDKGGAPNET